MSARSRPKRHPVPRMTNQLTSGGSQSASPAPGPPPAATFQPQAVPSLLKRRCLSRRAGGMPVARRRDPEQNGTGTDQPPPPVPPAKRPDRTCATNSSRARTAATPAGLRRLGRRAWRQTNPKRKSRASRSGFPGVCVLGQQGGASGREGACRGLVVAVSEARRAAMMDSK